MTAEERKRWLNARYEKGLCVDGCARPHLAHRKKCAVCVERDKDRLARLHKKRRQEIFDHYGERCVCCGETEPMFLVIDHVNNDGGTERGSGLLGLTFFNHIIREKFPDTYQILCYNCNNGKRINKGTCPHQTK